jgi:hypothetical protein
LSKAIAKEAYTGKDFVLKAGITNFPPTTESTKIIGIVAGDVINMPFLR